MGHVKLQEDEDEEDGRKCSLTHFLLQEWPFGAFQVIIMARGFFS